MIIFTITNKITAQVYVGNTRNDLHTQWEKMIAAAEKQLDYPLYKDILAHGADNFTIEVFDHIDTREELADVEQDAISLFNAKSLKGYKTTTTRISSKKKPRKHRTVSVIEKELMPLHGDDIHFNDHDDDEIPVPIQPKKAIATEEQELQEQELQEQKPQEQKAQKQKAQKQKAQKQKPQKQVIKTAATHPDTHEIPEFQPEKQSPPPRIIATIDVHRTTVAQQPVIEPATQKATKPAEKTDTETSVINTENVHAQSVPHSLSEACDKKKKVQQAIERHRQIRASRTSAKMNEEKKRISELLDELHSRAQANPQSNIRFNHSE